MTCERIPHGIVCRLADRIVCVKANGKSRRFEVGPAGAGALDPEDNVIPDKNVPPAAWAALSRKLQAEKEGTNG